MVALIGIDIGQKRDPTAICVAQSERRHDPAFGGNARHFVIRHLERLPLGTPYPEVADRIQRIVHTIRRQQDESSEIYVDATGVGAPVVDLLKERVSRMARLRPVYFTHGDRRTEEPRGPITLGKAFLVSRLQALLQTGRIHLPKTSEAEALSKELLDYEIRVDENANDRYGAFKVGTHDDLVTALGLAVQWEPRGPRFIGAHGIAPRFE